MNVKVSTSTATTTTTYFARACDSKSMIALFNSCTEVEAEDRCGWENAAEVVTLSAASKAKH